LQKYKGQVRTYNDDMQGSDAVTLAEAANPLSSLVAVRQPGASLPPEQVDQRSR
jgi:hypothetical protein